MFQQFAGSIGLFTTAAKELISKRIKLKWTYLELTQPANGLHHLWSYTDAVVGKTLPGFCQTCCLYLLAHLSGCHVVNCYCCRTVNSHGCGLTSWRGDCTLGRPFCDWLVYHATHGWLVLTTHWVSCSNQAIFFCTLTCWMTLEKTFQ